MTDCYVGESLYVRVIKTRSGDERYGLFRSGTGYCLDVFHSLAHANLVAEYIDLHGGSYEAKNRKAAKKFAQQNTATPEAQS